MILGSFFIPSIFWDIFHEPEHLWKIPFRIFKSLVAGEDFIKYREIGSTDEKKSLPV